MSGAGKVMKETCRTCLSYFTENNAKFSLLNCLAIAESCGRLELMRNVMSICSLTIFTTSAQEDMSEIFICLTCMIEINQMLSFLEKCIRSEEILKQATEVKEKSSSPRFSITQQSESEFVLKHEVKYDKTSQDSDGLPVLLGRNKNKNVEDDGDDDSNKKKNMKYECSDCHNTFPSPLSLAFHKYKHSGHKPHSCIVCHENFRTMQLIKEHMAVAHKNITYRPYICRLCSGAFATRQNLTRHQHRIHSAKKYSCGTCKRTFSTVSSLKFHENIHREIRPYSLALSSKSFDAVSRWKNRTSATHSDGSDGKQFKCHCGTSFNRKKKLELHVESVHENKDKIRKYQCPECDKKFHHPYSLKNHLNTHFGIKPFLCNVCGAAFTALSNLTSHFRRIHSGEKQPTVKKYLCHSCGDSFARASHLQRHTLRKHVPNVEKKHECPVCKKRFLEKSDLTGHVKLHDDVKPFACDQCSKSFRTGWRLQAHVKRVHLGLRPFECPTCRVKFKTKSHLEKHIRTHTGEKPFPCPHCAYSCAEKSNLKKHINVHMKTT